MSDEIVCAPKMEKRRPRASEREKTEWAERYYQSGLTQQQFCQQHGIAGSTLQRWVAENQRAGSGATTPPTAGLGLAFAEVKLGAGPTAAQWAAELCWPNGMSLRIGADLPRTLLEQLLTVC